MAYWIMRSEPETYGWDDLVRDRSTEWDGVRNATARIFLKEMQPGDRALFYHSGKQKAAVGIMEVTRAWKPDGEDGSWASVAVKAVEPLPRPVTLAAMKAEPRLKALEMLRLSRLSVTPVREEEWRTILEMAGR
ncbi:EVE domain-containing protein [Sphingomonas sp. DT-204]|uniref:EVE domain-containing protein n=1 Tax=Sphingomonas sp. DT-204 TaxID=3396166 RepID=UPI003F1AE51D